VDELQAIVDACEASGQKAALMWEPIQGEGGVNVSSCDFVGKLNELQSQGKLLIIADEVQTGFAGTFKSKSKIEGSIFLYCWCLILCGVLHKITLVFFNHTLYHH